jgi:hypothetical protein
MEENDLLTAPYSEEEVKKAVFQMEHNKARVLMVYLLNFTSIFGILLKWIFYKCLACYTLDS